MVNGLGVLGWGVGGIEAEAAMLGQPISMVIPEVVGFKLTGRLPEGATATDLVLTVTQTLRAKGVVGKFVEFCGPGLDHLPLADRATIGNMSPEYGATCGIFPIDAQTLEYLRLTGRDPERIALVEAYAKAQGLWRASDSAEPWFTEMLELDLATVEPSLAGPKRPQDRVALSGAKAAFEEALPSLIGTGSDPARRVPLDGMDGDLGHGDVVISAITSCTNTSNPGVMIGAGLLARNARRRGLMPKPYVKTSLAPGSRVVTDYLEKTGLMDDLRALGFDLVGYGCTTCIGNSGPLPDPVARAIDEHQLVAAAVLSGNRNFEGRVHPQVKANYLASPPLVVAYALAGTLRIDLTSEPLGTDQDGKPVYLRDIWPSPADVQATIQKRRQRPACSRTPTPTSSRATSTGPGSAAPAARSTTGRRPAPTSACRPTSRTSRPSPRRSTTSRAPACWRCSATASRPTTSRRPAASPGKARPPTTSWSARSGRRTSTPTARAAATTRS